MAAVLVYVTTPDRDCARMLGRAVVESHLAACANVIDGMTAIFRWNGAIDEANEAVLILKTTQDHVAALTDSLRALHPYEMPCIVAVPITGGNPDFLAWVAAEANSRASA